MLTFIIYISRNFLLSVVVISTSLLIYVVLYKNELLSNLYVLLQVLCFTTPLCSSLSLALSGIVLLRICFVKFDFELPIRFSQVCFVFVCKYYKSLHALSLGTKYLKQYFTSLSRFPSALLQIRPFICFGL